jgi:glycosyltransferase involved in cell wall biosynthesis
VSVTVAITTFNRAQYIVKMKKSLQETVDLETAHVRVYDDCSSDFDETYLHTMFPDAETILRSKRNLGCDENLFQAMKNFLTTDDEIFVIADSDLIFHPEWLRFLKRCFPLTDGVMSLYNSYLHPPIEQVKLDDVPFVRKSAIGAAGTVMDRKTVSTILESLRRSSHIDWKFSTILESEGIRLLVSQQSYVQHIGIHGKNNIGLKADFGLNFLPGSRTNEEIMTAYTEELLATIAQAPETLVPKTDLNYRVGKMLLSPVRFLKHPRRSLHKIISKQQT